MVKKYFLFLTAVAALSLAGAEFSISEGAVKAVFDTRGGGLKSLSIKGKELTRHDRYALSFTEKLLRSRKNQQIIEDFSKYEFTPVEVKKNSVTFTAKGVRNFDFLRLTKRFTVNGKNNTLKVEFTLENISDRPGDVGLWTRTMLRRNNGSGMRNAFFFHLGGKFVTKTHPGDMKTEEWFYPVTGAAAGIMGMDDKTGLVLLLPPERLCGFYSWSARDKDISSLEYFLNEKTLPPKSKESFQVTAVLTENLPVELKKYEKRALLPPAGKQPVCMDLYSGKVSGVKIVAAGENYFTPSVNYLDIKGKKQYCNSVRGVRIPGNINADNISVYTLANGAPEFDRPVPFTVEKLSSGEQRILVQVPGVNKYGYYYTVFQEGFAYNRYGRPSFCGSGDFAYRICFDRKAEKLYPAGLFKGGPDLIDNGSFERQMANAPWAESFYWSWFVRDRKFYHWVNEGQDKSRCIKVVRVKDTKHFSIFPVFFRPEEGVKYHFSADMRGENPEHNWISCMAEFEDENRKNIRKLRLDLANSKNAYPWKKVQKSFYSPRGIHYGTLRFGISSHLQTLWIDNVKIVPEDFTYIKRSAVERLRAEVKEASYGSLDFLEKISHEYVTPHTKWLTNPVDPMPEILYLPLGSTRTIQYTGKRQIVEFAQRMKLAYRFIPLLRKVDSGGARWDVSFGKGFESYTLAQLDEIKNAPKVIIIQDIDFALMADEKFLAALKKFLKGGSSFLFYNCNGIPKELLGKEIQVPSEIFAAPVFRNLGKGTLRRACTVYQNGKSRIVCFTRNRSEWYIDAYPFPCVPQEFAREMCPAYQSRDFQYWEYIYLSAIKALRYAAGVEPAVKVTGSKGTTLLLHSRKDLTAQIKVAVQDMHRRPLCSFVQKVELKPGVNSVPLALPAAPGGTFVADCRVTDLQGREYDCGALNYTLPDPNKVTVEFAQKEAIFERGKEVKAQISLAGTIPAGALLVYEVEDTRNRIVKSGSLKALAVNNLSFKVAPPYTTLYRLKLSLQQGKKELSRGYAEFSMPSPGKDLTQLDALIWLGRTPLLQLASDLGFTYWITNFMQDGVSMGRSKAVANANLGQVMYGAGHANYKTSLKYRHDIPSDPVRTPCYSDPGHWKTVEEIVRKTTEKQRFRYYGVQLHEIADEAYLGSTVCYSQHCLRDFRTALKAQYGSLENLNKNWQRTFKNWDEVVPVQLKEVSGKENLAPWLDHKMFMAKVFAKNWVGNTRDFLKKYVPNSKAGLSGTQVPGYSYDWVQLMKHIDCLSYYGGIQRKAVHDFAGPGFVSGMWGGGYARPEILNEFYQKSGLWADLFLGANMVSNFAGHAFNGDCTPVKNTLFYTELVNEMRQGLDRIVLNSKEIGRDVAILYSQSSLFAAMGGIGGGIWQNSQTGWSALLEDLKYNYFYLPYDTLEKELPKARVVILPCSISLSPAAVKNLQKFTAAGGVVIADFAPGWYDEHGIRKVNPDIEKLFGISRAQSRLSTAAEKLVTRAGKGFPAIQGELRIGEKGLAAVSAEKLGKEIFFVNRYGKGKAILLNILLSGYQDINLGGVGGEELKVKDGAYIFCENMRKVVRGLLESSAVSVNSRVTELANGKLYPCTTMLRKDGENYVFGILKHLTASPDGKAPMVYDKKFISKLKVALPVKGHIYDVRKGKYLGLSDNLTIDLMPGEGQLFSIQKNKVGDLKMVLPAEVRKSDAIEVKWNLAGAVDGQVFRLELFDPAGQLVKNYTATGHFAPGKGKFVFQFAMNDPAGLWKCRIVHVNSGKFAEKSINVK